MKVFNIQKEISILVAASLVLVGSAHAAPLIQAVPIYFFEKHLKSCSSVSLDLSCLAAKYMMTIDPAEVAALKKDKWSLDATQALVFAQPAQGTIPLYRYSNPKSSDHLFTTDPQEGTLAINNLGYVAEGICCYISPNPQPGTTRLYRYVIGNQHEYLLVNNPSNNQEGSPGYVWTIPNGGALPTLPAGTPPPEGPTTPPGYVAAVDLFFFRASHGDPSVVTCDLNSAYQYANDPNQRWTTLGDGESYRMQAYYQVFPSPATGVTQLYSYYNAQSKDNFYTTSASEGAAATYKGYAPTATSCYVSPTQAPGTVALYRLRKGAIHRYLTDAIEIETIGVQGWSVEGVAGYIWRKPSPPAPPVILPAQ